MDRGLWQRRAIYSFFIMVFVVSLPLIFLYAQGYKYNFKKGQWQKTGVIFIDTHPRRVNIFLNGKKIDEKVPARIRKLLPSEYNLKITKAGYHLWEKNIRVSEGQTTLLQYIRLFKNNEKLHLLYSGLIEKIDFSPAENIFAFEIKNEQGFNTIKLFKPNRNEVENVLITEEDIKTMKFIENGRRLLVKTLHKIWLVESENGDKYDLSSLIGQSDPKGIKINSYNSNYIYYLKDDALYMFNLITNKSERLFKGQMLDYLVDDGYLYYLKQSSLNSIFLNRVSLIDKNSIGEKKVVLPTSKGYKLIEATKNFIIIKIEDRDDFILINKHNWRTKPIKNVIYWSWSEDQNQLVYGNHSELWVFKLEPDGGYKDILITRSSQPISNGAWLSKMTHVFYGVGGKIKAVENLAWNRQVTDLVKIRKVNWVMLSEKGDKLYFSGINQLDEAGLFELIIQ